jgi:hypothetical protein
VQTTCTTCRHGLRCANGTRVVVLENIMVASLAAKDEKVNQMDANRVKPPSVTLELPELTAVAGGIRNAAALFVLPSATVDSPVAARASNWLS